MKHIKTILIAFSICSMLGCTTVIEPKIESTKSWEQHYKSVKDFKVGTENIVLDDNETIWVLSNKTLKRLLLNVK